MYLARAKLSADEQMCWYLITLMNILLISLGLYIIKDSSSVSIIVSNVILLHLVFLFIFSGKGLEFSDYFMLISDLPTWCHLFFNVGEVLHTFIF